MAKRKIVAIGGGEIGRPGYPIETKPIDLEIIRLTGRKHPKLLFLPTASSDSESYWKVVQRYFGKLGCRTDKLYLIREKPCRELIKSKILGSDIIYVGGGNTLKMLKAWRRYGVEKVLKQAMDRGIVLSGLSAGAICWFKHGNSDSLRFGHSRNKRLIKVRGCGFLDLAVCPHYNTEKKRRPSVHSMIKKNRGIAIALDECAAFEVVGQDYRILTSKRNAKAYRVFRTGGRVIEEELPKDSKLRPLKTISTVNKK